MGINYYKVFFAIILNNVVFLSGNQYCLFICNRDVTMPRLKTIGKRVDIVDTVRTSPVAIERIRGTTLQRIRQRVLMRDKWLCQECIRHGATTIATEVDHIVPLCFGGSESDSNRQSLCHECHMAKSGIEAGQRG